MDIVDFPGNLLANMKTARNLPKCVFSPQPGFQRLYSSECHIEPFPHFLVPYVYFFPAADKLIVFYSLEI